MEEHISKKEKTKILFTIITSTFNADESLQRCLDSVRNQDYKFIEHIIIDGDSKDNTVEIIRNEAIIKKSRIEWWNSEPDSGIYNAWNKALDQVKGDWVLFLGADDYLYEDRIISKIATYLESIDIDKVKIVFGKAKREDENNFVLNNWKDVKDIYRSGKNIFPHAATFHHCSLFEKYGKFDESYRIGGDTEYMYRYIMKNDSYFINEYITHFSIGGVSTSPEFKKTKINESYRIKKKYNQPISLGLEINKWVWNSFNIKVASLLSGVLKNIFSLFKRSYGKFNS